MRIAIGQQLHRMADLVVFEEIVPGMNVLFAILPTFVTRLRFILFCRQISCAAYGLSAFPG